MSVGILMTILLLAVPTTLSSTVYAQGTTEENCMTILRANATNHTEYDECKRYFGSEFEAEQAQSAKNNATRMLLDEKGYDELSQDIRTECSTRTNLTLIEKIECINYIDRIIAANQTNK